MESLVNYTDSESDSNSCDDEIDNNKNKRRLESNVDDECKHQPPKKKIRKLPSLNNISPHLFNNDKKLDEMKHSNDKHQGRIRKFDHIDGNWSIHIHIAINDKFNQLFNEICNIIINNNNKETIIHKMDQYHISLSICQSIKTFQIKDFVDSFIKLFKDYKDKRPFNISLNGLKFYSNDTYSV